MPPLLASTGFSPAGAEQLGHNLLMRQRARAACSDPLVMCSERRLDLGFLECLGRGVPLDRLQPP